MLTDQERESAAWQAIGGLGFILAELHRRGDLTDFGHARCAEHLDALRDALSHAD